MEPGRMCSLKVVISKCFIRPQGNLWKIFEFKFPIMGQTHEDDNNVPYVSTT